MARLEQEHDEHLADISIQLLRLQVKRRIGNSIHCNVCISFFGKGQSPEQGKASWSYHTGEGAGDLIFSSASLLLEGGATFELHTTDLRNGA